MVINLTGHRPFQFDKRTNRWISKLEYTNDSGTLIKGNSLGLYLRLTQLFKAYYMKHPEITTVISGMAMGVDLAGADAAIALGIPVHAYIPYPGHGSEWKTFYRDLHSEIAEAATELYVPSEKPKESEFAKFLLQRNKDMVDNSDFTLALWDGTPGGTAHCVSYAQNKRGELWGTNLWPHWERNRGRK